MSKNKKKKFKPGQLLKLRNPYSTLRDFTFVYGRTDKDCSFAMNEGKIVMYLGPPPSWMPDNYECILYEETIVIVQYDALRPL